MNFILTTYIYPIKKEIPISTKLKFSLDNPRTNEEIEIIKMHLEKSLNSPEEFYKDGYYANLPVFLTNETQNFVSIESTLGDFNKNYSKIDSYVKSFFEKNEKSDVLEKLAKMWIIGRFEDEGEYARMEKSKAEMEKEGQRGFFMLDKGNPIIDNSDSLIHF